MYLEIITPETKIFAGEAESVQLPGLDGSFQVLNNHAPIISGLTSGTVKAELSEVFEADEKTSRNLRTEGNGKTILVDIKGGVIEMSNNKIVVLAE